MTSISVPPNGSIREGSGINTHVRGCISKIILLLYVGDWAYCSQLRLAPRDWPFGSHRRQEPDDSARACLHTRTYIGTCYANTHK